MFEVVSKPPRESVRVPHTTNLRRDLLIMLALLADFTCAYMIALVWKLELYYFAIVPITSFIVGVLVVNLKKCLAYTCSSLVISGVITVGILVSPMMIRGDASEIDTSAFIGFNSVAKLLVISIILCVCGALIGGLLGENWE